MSSDYAVSAVAEVSRRALAGGAPQVTLFTDLANPTANKIYAEVGYRRFGDGEEHAFHPPGSGPLKLRAPDADTALMSVILDAAGSAEATARAPMQATGARCTPAGTDPPNRTGARSRPPVRGGPGAGPRRILGA